MSTIGLIFVIFGGLFGTNRCTAQTNENQTVRITVQTTRGSIIGFHVNNADNSEFYSGEADVFLGVPYAVPPVGELRFQRTKLIDGYTDPIDASRFGKICPQIDGEIDAATYGTGIDEDCLTLNIISPNVTDRGRKHPVMVYIHGGALKFGNVAEWGYRGIVSNIVRRGVVWVSFNYRLGLFGFFTTNTTEFPANRGIWDQITALKWIQQEIDKFGGDPNRVTLIGHSAGACSASLLALSPAVDHSLFQSMILHSCSAEVCFDQLYGKFTQSFDRAEQICKINARTEGWTTNNVLAMKKCLDQLNHTQISAHDIEPLRWNVVIDDKLFPDVPAKMHWRNIPVLLGSTKDEYALFVQWSLKAGRTYLEDYTPAKVSESIRYWLGKIFGDEIIDDVWSLVVAVYGKLDVTADHIHCIKYMTRVLSDLIYIRAVGEEAETFVKMGNPNVWLWHLNFKSDFFSFYRLTGYKPSFHGIELYSLLQPENAWISERQWNVRDIAVSDMLAVHWTNFAKNGKPSPEWLRTTPDQLNHWQIGERTDQIKIERHYGGKKYLFWKSLTRLIRQLTDSNSSSVPHRMHEEL